MLYLLYAATITEALVITILLFKTPVRKLVIWGLDSVKRGRGPIVVKTVAGTVFVVFVSTVYSVVGIRRKRGEDGGEASATDQVLVAKHMLEASLMGFFLFLALLVDRLHHYIRELRIRRKGMEAVKKNDVKFVGVEDMKAREEQLGTFKAMIRQLESDLENKTKEAGDAESSIEALRKQSEGLLLEYDRLLAENQELRGQLQSLDQRLSHSPIKKNS